MHDLRLKVDGTLYGGWKTVRIQRSIKAIAGSFELSVTDRWSGQATPRPIRPGAACQVLIDDKSVITGYVDDVNISYDAGARSISIAGRDNTGDLVDCSVPHGQIHNQNLLELAEKLCKPYDIKVLSETDIGVRFETFTPNSEESVFEALSRKARARGVLLNSDGNGRLVIARASKERIRSILLLGENILACSASFSHKDRFSEYTVIGSRNPTDDDSTVDVWAHISAKSSDTAVARHRPLRINTSESIHQKTARLIADWERNVHYGQSQRIQYTVQGWNYDTGKLWPINRLVAVKDESIGVDADLLISTVAFLLDDGGTRTEMELVPREAFDLLALPKDGDPWSSL